MCVADWVSESVRYVRACKEGKEANVLFNDILNSTTMKDQSDDPSRQERTLLPRSYISLHFH